MVLNIFIFPFRQNRVLFMNKIICMIYYVSHILAISRVYYHERKFKFFYPFRIANFEFLTQPQIFCGPIGSQMWITYAGDDNEAVEMCRPGTFSPAKLDHESAWCHNIQRCIKRDEVSGISCPGSLQLCQFFYKLNQWLSTFIIFLIQTLCGYFPQIMQERLNLKRHFGN